MSDYERSTRLTRLDALPPELRTAVADRAELSQLTLAPDAVAFVSRNRRLKKSGLLRRGTGSGDPDPEHQVAVVIGARDVVVVVHGVVRGTSVLTARLEDVEVADLAAQFGALAAKVEDRGITVTGFPGTVESGASARGSFFVGLGAPDGDAAGTLLRDAVRTARE